MYLYILIRILCLIQNLLQCEITIKVNYYLLAMLLLAVLFFLNLEVIYQQTNYFFSSKYYFVAMGVATLYIVANSFYNFLRFR